jgi:hypothetical protein
MESELAGVDSGDNATRRDQLLLGLLKLKDLSACERRQWNEHGSSAAKIRPTTCRSLVRAAYIVALLMANIVIRLSQRRLTLQSVSQLSQHHSLE